MPDIDKTDSVIKNSSLSTLCHNCHKMFNIKLLNRGMFNANILRSFNLYMFAKIYITCN